MEELNPQSRFWRPLLCRLTNPLQTILFIKILKGQRKIRLATDFNNRILINAPLSRHILMRLRASPAPAFPPKSSEIPTYLLNAFEPGQSLTFLRFTVKFAKI